MSTFPSDIEIAQSATLEHIRKIAEKINIQEDDLEYY
jgi:formate--tetrahydrofolate ligase